MKRKHTIRLAIWPYGDYSVASSRYRIFNFVPYLTAVGIQCLVIPGGRVTIRVFLIAILYILRADCVLIQKKILPVFILQWIRLLKKPVLYDFDDALYTPRSAPREKHIRFANEARESLQKTLAISQCVIAGNPTLAAYAQKYARRIQIIPTVFDASGFAVKNHSEKPTLVIGWIGSGGGHIYLDTLEEVFEKLAAAYGEQILFRTVSSDPYAIGGLESYFDSRIWSLQTESADILSFDIGIMPLTDDDWSRGKCGFKILQMMGYGLPVVASPVGINREIIQDGRNGFLANTPDEWVDKLTQLISSAKLRESLGGAGRAMVLRDYPLALGESSLERVIREAGSR
jgi:glycosyltransferase involved in cell wall biosynthesis